MKIDKIVFSASEQFSPFWNLQAEVWSNMGIKPILLLWGKKENTNVSDHHGEVIECGFDTSLPEVLQITLSKFYFPITDPDSTWMVGDIDLFPLQTKYYCDLGDVVFGNKTYYHIDAPGMDPLKEPWTVGVKGHGNKRLYGHSHIAKGSLMNHLYVNNRPFFDVVKFVVESDIYGNRSQYSERIHQYHWCAEEDYTTQLLNQNFLNNNIDVHIKTPENHGLRISRNRFNFSGYEYDSELLRNQGYIDIHCHRPFSEQENSLVEILTIAGMISR